MGTKLTPEQLKHWREVFPEVFGHSADGFSDEMVQAMKDRLQMQFDDVADADADAEIAKNVAMFVCDGCAHPPHPAGCPEKSLLVIAGDSKFCNCAHRS